MINNRNVYVAERYSEGKYIYNEMSKGNKMNGMKGDNVGKGKEKVGFGAVLEKEINKLNGG